MNSYKRIEKVNYRGFYNIIQVNKNDSVCNVLKSEPLDQGKYQWVKDSDTLSAVSGNQYKIALNKIKALIDVQLLND